jgi:hypothetical protein
VVCKLRESMALKSIDGFYTKRDYWKKEIPAKARKD